MRILISVYADDLAALLHDRISQEPFVDAVESVPDTLEAAAYAESSLFEIIVMSRHRSIPLPTIVRSLRDRGIKSHIMGLVHTDSWETQVEVLDAGCDYVVALPCNIDAICAQIRAIERRINSAKNGIVHIGDLEIHTHTKRVWAGGELIKLTAHEYRVLLYLAQNAGTIITRQDVRLAMYATERERSNTVEVFVGRVRRKIAPAASGIRIRTVRGMGYMLEAEHPTSH